MKRMIHFLSIAFISLLLGGCKLAILDPKGIIAADEKHIMITAVALMLIVVVPVIFLTLLFAWRYRETNTTATYDPEWSFNTIIEIVCWAIPIVIIAILGTITWISTHRLDPFNPIVSKEKPIIIQVIALQWKWLFIYPEEHIATINYLQFPVDVPVKFMLTAEGPMNALQIPQLGGQIYAMAGMQSFLHLQASEIGDYRGLSTQFSGNGFSDMNFTAHVGTKEQYKNWVQSVKKSGPALTLEEYSKLLVPTEKNPVKYYTAPSNTLFETVVMKAMMPFNEAQNICNNKKLAGG